MELAKVIVGLFAVTVAFVAFIPMNLTFLTFVFSSVGGFLITHGLIGIIRNNR